MTHNIIQRNYNSKQLRLPLDLEIKIPFDSEVRTFVEVMSGVNVDKYFVSGSKNIGRTGYNPTKMLDLILFCMSEGITSVRQMEKAARNDIRIMWLTDEMQPSHMTISRFIKDELTKNIEDIFKEINNRLIEIDNIDTDRLYVDGTKIEAKSNKYTFVWKKTIIKNRIKLYTKIAKTMEKLNSYYSCESLFFNIKDDYEIEEMEQLFSFISKEVDKSGITFVHGKGSRKKPLQRFHEQISEYLETLRKYNQQIETCGEHRNSYSKTDNDATFMRMKSDHMRNGQLKPGYNVQIGVSYEYIMTVGVFQDRSDHGTFIPLMNNYLKMYGKLPIYITADAGYGNFYNYKFLKEHNLPLFLKFTNYKKAKKNKKFKDDPFRGINFKCNENGTLNCPNGKTLHLVKVADSEVNGYDRKTHHFHCSECDGCPLREKCTTSNKGRTVQINFEGQELEKEAYENLNTDLGNELKIQRSIQVEGAFGVLKEAFNFKRFKRTNIENVTTEVYLFACGFNLKKYHNKKYRVIH